MDEQKVHDMTDEELAYWSERIRMEREERKARAEAPARIDAEIRRYQAAMGRQGGAEWVQPAGPLDSYPRGAVVTHEGQRWSSTMHVNVHTPGVSGWRQVGEMGDNGLEIPAVYLQPSGAHDAYQKSERITWEDGLVYAAARDGVVHTPAEYPADWILEGQEEPEPEPEEPEDDGTHPDGTEDPDPEPGPEPEAPRDWAVGATYVIGDKVTYQGVTYRLIQDHTSAAHWPPDQVASIYEVV